MRAAVPRSKTPVGAHDDGDDNDAAAVQASDAADLTQPESAPPVRMTPVPSLPPPDFTRSRKETLVSPIPALLAAQMIEIHEERGGATPLPVDLRGDATSRFAASDQEALLRDDESDSESEYVVELVEAVKADIGR